MNEYRESVIEKFIEIESLDDDRFLKLKETLTRIGVVSKTEQRPSLYQSVHVFHNKNRYYLVHFKQMFLLDGRVKSTNLTQLDLDRLSSIAHLLQKWGFVKLKTEVENSSVRVHVIPYAEKNNWNLETKYAIGGNRRRNEYE